MAEYDTISTETWKIHLPSNWSEQQSGAENTLCLESADHTKGAYLSTWCFSDDPRSAKEILESFRSVELRSFQAMKDKSWESVSESSSDLQDATALAIDLLDRQAHYRIVCYLLCRLPWVVRASFHDYDCADYEVSRQFFQPIIESLQIH